MDIDVIAQNAIKIATNEGKKIYIDPFKLSNIELDYADVIFITHSHYDHFSTEDINKIKDENTKIVITRDLYEKTIALGFEEQNITKISSMLSKSEFCGEPSIFSNFGIFPLVWKEPKHIPLKLKK